MGIKVLTGFPPGYTYEPIGLVASSEVVGVGPFRDFVARLKDAFGGRVGGLRSVFDDALRRLTTDMVQQASRMGANAVAGLEFDSQILSTSRGGIMVMVVGYGTACRIHPKGTHTQEPKGAIQTNEPPAHPSGELPDVDAYREEEDLDTWFK